MATAMPIMTPRMVSTISAMMIFICRGRRKRT
jgi:hypothetical protein